MTETHTSFNYEFRFEPVYYVSEEEGEVLVVGTHDFTSMQNLELPLEALKEDEDVVRLWIHPAYLWNMIENEATIWYEQNYISESEIEGWVPCSYLRVP